jgi:hypothetical protein
MAGVLRLCFPESVHFTKKVDQYDEDEAEERIPRKVKANIFVRQIAFMIRNNWPTMLYMLVLVSFICGVAMNSVRRCCTGVRTISSDGNLVRRWTPMSSFSWLTRV